MLTPAVLGPARPGRDDDAVGLLGADAVHVDGVVAEHDGIGAELAELLDEVVGEGVVIVDDDDPGAHGKRLYRPWRVAPSWLILGACRAKQGPGSAARKGRSGGRVTAARAVARPRQRQQPLHPAHPPQRQGQPQVDGPARSWLLLILGALMIVFNYFNVLPAGPSNWYLVGGIVFIAGGFVVATQYR